MLFRAEHPWERSQPKNYSPDVPKIRLQEPCTSEKLGPRPFSSLSRNKDVFTDMVDRERMPGAREATGANFGGLVLRLSTDIRSTR